MDPPPLVPRLYQGELLQAAIASNIILRMDTGSGKTLVAILLIKHLSSLPLPEGKTLGKIVFLVPIVALVRQQADTIRSQTSLKVIELWGEMGIDYWEREKWVAELEKGDVIVCTPQIWLNALSNAYFSMEKTALLILDEAHHASKNHPMARIMKDHYHPLKTANPSARLPKVMGMTASPIYNAKTVQKALKSIQDLEETLHARLVEVKLNAAELERASKRPRERLVEFQPVPVGIAGVEDSPFEEELCQILNEITLKDKHWIEIQQTKARLGEAGRNLSLSSLLTEWLSDDSKAVYHPRLRFLFTTLRAFLAPSVLLASLSDQLEQLFNLLAQYSRQQQQNNFHAIVFVQRRNDARIIKELVELWSKERADAAWIKPGFLVGHGGIGGKEGGEQKKKSEMKTKEQNRVVAAFRSGEMNVVFATQVAEEGLDFAACNVVIRFDPIQTVKGYIQSRGRARAENSEFIVLAGRNSAEAETYREFVAIEPELRKEYQDRPTDETDEPELEGLETYTVPSTGALLTHYAAPSLLSEFCSLLPKDPFVPLQQPKYTIVPSAGVGPFSGTVTLPMIAALKARREFKGESQPTKRAAKQSCAFFVCIELHKAGALNDYLLPIRLKRDELALDADGRISRGEALAPKVKISSPNIFGNVWSPKSLINLSLIEIEDAGEVTLIGLICGGSLDLFAVGKMWDMCPDREIVVRRKSSRLLEWGEEERQGRLEMLEVFNRNCFRATINRRIDESRLLALWAPMLSDLSDIDWDLLGSAFQKVDLSLLTPETTIVVPYRRVSKRLFHFVSTRTDVTTLSSTALIETDAGAARQKLARRYPNYFVYTKVAYDFHDLDEATEDAILELRSLPDHPGNHLSLVALKAGNVPYAPVVKNLPLGMCRVSILSASFWGTIRKTPSLLRLIHDWVQVKLAIQKFDLPPIDIPLFIEALTPPIAHCGFDYELLETCGDAVLKMATSIHVYLKYPNFDEGQLSTIRQNSVDNRSLRNRCTTIGLSSYILGSTFRTLAWTSPAYDESEISLDGTLIHHAWVNKKALADTMESTLGAAFLTGGIEMALKAGTSLGLCFGGGKRWDERDWSLYRPRERISVPKALVSLEERIGYSFKDGRKLLQAVTHRSFGPATTFCYEREEYLGDAILDFWATNLLITLFPSSTPRKLTYLRALLVSGSTLSFLALQLAIPSYLLHNSPTLHFELKQAATEAAGYDSASILKDLTWIWDPPKVLGDVVEAIIGSVFVDSGGRLDECTKFLDKLYSEIVPLIVADTERRDPHSKLIMKIQELGCREFKITNAPPDEGAKDKGVHKAQVLFHSLILATETSRSKSIARQLACRKALGILEDFDQGGIVARCQCKKEARQRKKEEELKMDLDSVGTGQTAVEDELGEMELGEETLVEELEKPSKKRKSEQLLNDEREGNENGDDDDDDEDESPDGRVRVYY